MINVLAISSGVYVQNRINERYFIIVFIICSRMNIGFKKNEGIRDFIADAIICRCMNVVCGQKLRYARILH